MSNKVLKIIVLFFLAIILQVLVLNKITVSPLFSPFIFFFPFLVFKENFPKALLLLLGFAVGFLVDFISGSIGLHTASCVLICFLKPVMSNIFSNKSSADGNKFPSTQSFGRLFFLIYLFLMILIYHSCFFVLEIFSFTHFAMTLLQIIISSLSSFIIILILLYNRKNA